MDILLIFTLCVDQMSVGQMAFNQKVRNHPFFSSIFHLILGWNHLIMIVVKRTWQVLIECKENIGGHNELLNSSHFVNISVFTVCVDQMSVGLMIFNQKMRHHPFYILIFHLILGWKHPIVIVDKRTWQVLIEN